MKLPQVSLQTFRRLTLLGVVLLGLIVVTGGVVRLTSSGLGCPTWPQCGDGSLVPHGHYAVHGVVEFGNRLVSAAVGALMLILPLASLRLSPRRRDLTLLSLGLWVGFLGQAVLGGLTVLFKLNPGLVAGHFLLSMLLVFDVVVLDVRTVRLLDPHCTPAPPRWLTWLARLLVAAAGMVLVLGTIVTGSGPHSGDSGDVVRFGFDVRDVAQVHADAAMLLVGLVVAMAFAVRASGVSRQARRESIWLLGIVLAQAAIGFTQYFLGVPVGLVGLHVAGATLLWIFSLRLMLRLSPPRAATVSVPGPTAQTGRAGRQREPAPTSV